MKLDFTIFACLKLEEHLFLPHFGKVELVPIKRLEDLINTELSRPFLQVAALVQLSNETILTRNDLNEHLYSKEISMKTNMQNQINIQFLEEPKRYLGFTGSNIIAK